MSWTVRSEDSPEPNKTTLLPFAALPKALPGSTLRIGHLTLCRLRLLSVKDLVNCVAHLGMMELSVEEVTFVDGAVTHLVRRRSRRHSRLQIIHIIRCFENGDLGRQCSLANLLFASQGRMHVDDATLALAEKTLAALSSGGPPYRADLRYNVFDSTEPCELQLSSRPKPLELMISVHSYGYSVSADGAPTAHVRALLPARTPSRQKIEYMQLVIPETSPAPSKLALQWGGIEQAILDLHPPRAVPPLRITCPSRAQATDVLAHLFLRDAILPRLCALDRVNVEIRDGRLPLWLDVSGAEILSAPMRLALGGLDVVLSDAQRAEWLVCPTDDEKTGVSADAAARPWRGWAERRRAGFEWEDRG
ncbi:uncharacterized protein PHACADRAFT_214945 [Phanerochaete carnosa HHB-10118-sp]|uniref:Uncharacterized protein n=1 Tax=Phanerochaete carnosa (strain HHB-10118-sp) TaxID=650164 RepID=K5WD68_PHACS|nr:uncharacterized protein PHACADRAFT_214945 [Phanerochaete carnosa HHB-10118-sp]EKM48127.1 hypothetical protein PHACADRAFT_214945 [Phanerochaete carnosa HHB-10118-sp]